MCGITSGSSRVMILREIDTRKSRKSVRLKKTWERVRRTRSKKKRHGWKFVCGKQMEKGDLRRREGAEGCLRRRQV